MTARLEGEVVVAEGSGEHEGRFAVGLNGVIFTDDIGDAALVRYLIECIPDTIAFAREQAESNKPVVFKIIDLFKFAEDMRERHVFSIENVLESHGRHAAIEESAESYDSEPSRVCRVCGCTEADACYDPETETMCSWVDADLCSWCRDAA